MNENFLDYLGKYNNLLNKMDISKKVNFLLNLLTKFSEKKKKVFFCGNGGSAGNANHIVNDFEICLPRKKKIIAESLSSNPSIITCIANDFGYENIFFKQLEGKISSNDMLFVLSGSGNSKNIIKAIKYCKSKKIFTFGIVGFDGGMAKKLLDDCIHIRSKNMQLCEDFQMIILHYCIRKLFKN